MIIDSHVHVFPFFGGPSGYVNQKVRLMYLQRALASPMPSQVRRCRDHRRVSLASSVLWDDERPGPDGQRDVRIRVGTHGRIVWTHRDEDYYVQLFPPSLDDMIMAPETIVAMMDWAGVDMAVLQNDHNYGSLNRYFSESVHSFPDRFIGLLQVDEAKASDAECVDLLDAGTRDLGLRGVYFKTLGLFQNNGRYKIDSADFHHFWARVQDLDLPVFWDISPPHDTAEFVCRELEDVSRLLEAFPRIRGVIQGGILRKIAPLAESSDERTTEALANLLTEHAVMLEILYPIAGGDRFEYPYLEFQHAIQDLKGKVGTEKLVWGSDAPNVERYCTYRQSLDYVKDHCGFLTSEDKGLLLGGNLRELFRLPVSGSGDPSGWS